jgi:hypothetical protein
MIGPLAVRFRTAVKVNEVTKMTKERERGRESGYAGSVAGKR